MSKPRKGYVQVTKEGHIYARVQFTDIQGHRRDIKIPAQTKTEAHLQLRELNNELDTNESGVLSRKKTFASVAEEFDRVRLIPAVFRNGVKVRGVKSIQTPKLILRRLVAHFGNKPIQAITRQDVEDYRTLRMQTPVSVGKTKGRIRSIRSVNSDLGMLRQVIYFAVENGWFTMPPRSLFLRMISPAAENRRTRLITADEEERLLAACDAHKRAHLKPLIIAALDTCMRRGSLLQLRWKDIDWESRTLYASSTMTKTQRSITVGMTDRLEAELLKWFKLSDGDPESLVFGIRTSFKTAFRSACEDAGIEGLTFHDLRASAITKMLRAGISEEFIRKVSGHTTPRILRENYVRIDQEVAHEIADKLNRFLTPVSNASQLES